MFFNGRNEHFDGILLFDSAGIDVESIVCKFFKLKFEYKSQFAINGTGPDKFKLSEHGA